MNTKFLFALVSVALFFSGFSHADTSTQTTEQVAETTEQVVATTEQTAEQV